MIDPAREIRPEDFAVDPDRVFMGSNGEEKRKAYFRERNELKRRYEEQEESKANARLKREQAAKNAIPYSEELVTEICGRISAGELLINVCQESNMPTVKRCNEWLKMHSDFKALYDESIQDRLLILEEQSLQISDDIKNDFKTIVKNGKERRVVDPEVIARAKLRVESRFKYLRAYKPERWAEQSTLITKSVDECEGLSIEELDARIADLDAKNRHVRSAAG